MFENPIDIAFNKATALCARQEYCCSEIREKLRKWNNDEDTSQKVIARLVEEKYIDEKRYSEFYVRDKFRFNKWGKQKIVWQLRQKRIPEEYINSALETIDDEEYKSTLSSILKEKARSLGKIDAAKKKASLIRFAVSRGFRIDEIMTLVEQFL